MNTPVIMVIGKIKASIALDHVTLGINTLLLNFAHIIQKNVTITLARNPSKSAVSIATLAY
jgi:hypothetical protein